MGAADKYPLVTMGIPAYNGELKLAKALKSVVNQNYPRLEILISDNASTDKTPEIIQSFLPDDRITYYRQPENLGIIGNFNFLLKKASGKYFMWIAADDELAPNVVEKYVAFLEENPSYVLACGIIDYWDKDTLYNEEKGLSLEGKSGIRRTFQYYRKVSQGALIYGLYRRSAIAQLEMPNLIGNDWHFVAAASFLGKVKHMNIVGYHKNAGGLSVNFHAYVKAFQVAKIWGYFPFVKISIDAFNEILFRNPVYRQLKFSQRFYLASLSLIGINFRYYFILQPKVWGGKVLRFFQIKTPREKRLEIRKNSLVEQIGERKVFP